MSVSFIFSFILFQVASSEIDSRFDNLEQRLQIELGSRADMIDLDLLRSFQVRQSETNLLVSLAYMNIAFLAIGGVASYFMARRTLDPIEQAHEAQSRFTSDASHELRTPLAAMKTELEVALRDPKLSKTEMRELLESNLEEVDKLSKISQTLLLLSRLEHGRELATGRVAINDIVRRVAERPSLSKGRIIYDAPEKSLYIKAHQVSIEELVVILIDNALKYSPAKSKVYVSLRRRGRSATLQITNSGKGIHPKDLPFIFERFYRADESRAGGEKTGFGLGLALAKRIVEIHNGDLNASSGAGKETTLTVSLPLFTKSNSKRKSQQK